MLNVVFAMDFNASDRLSNNDLRVLDKCQANSLTYPPGNRRTLRDPQQSCFPNRTVLGYPALINFHWLVLVDSRRGIQLSGCLDLRGFTPPGASRMGTSFKVAS